MYTLRWCQKLIEKIHFSNKKPENKNIALTNKKEKMIKIFANNKWKYKNKEEILDELINTNYTRMDDFYSEKGKDKLPDNKKKILMNSRINLGKRGKVISKN